MEEELSPPFKIAVIGSKGSGKELLIGELQSVDAKVGVPVDNSNFFCKKVTVINREYPYFKPPPTLLEIKTGEDVTKEIISSY